MRLKVTFMSGARSVGLALALGLCAVEAQANPCEQQLLGAEPGVSRVIESRLSQVTALAVSGSQSGATAVGYFDRLTSKAMLKVFDANGKEKLTLDLHDILSIRNRPGHAQHFVTALAFKPKSEILVVADNEARLFFIDTANWATVEAHVASLKAQHSGAQNGRAFVAQLMGMSSHAPVYSIKFANEREALLTGDREMVTKIEVEQGKDGKIQVVREVLNPPSSAWNDSHINSATLVKSGEYMLFGGASMRVTAMNANPKKQNENYFMNHDYLPINMTYESVIERVGRDEVVVAGTQFPEKYGQPNLSFVRIFNDSMPFMKGFALKKWPMEFEMYLPESAEGGQLWVQKVIPSKDGKQLLLVGFDKVKHKKMVESASEDMFLPGVRFMIVDRAAKTVLKDWKRFHQASPETHRSQEWWEPKYMPRTPIELTADGASLWVPGPAAVKPGSEQELTTRVYKLEVEALFKL